MENLGDKMIIKNISKQDREIKELNITLKAGEEKEVEVPDKYLDNIINSSFIETEVYREKPKRKKKKKGE